MDPRNTITSHPWHGVSPGANAPDVVNVIVEIPRDGKVKYELDKDSGLLKVDRVLFSAVHYPANYGFIPQTLADDSDPLDVLVLCQEPVVPLALMQTRPIGLMTMVDEGKIDHKIIGVAVGDAEFNAFSDLQSLPKHRLEMVRRFFMDYKTLEKKNVEVRDFSDATTAKEVIRKAIRQYQN
ncbi:inorganic diphosphatase [Allorhodopirellula solitaria]|uniref:Inorganic pyrophosphatase n=1 Tax=Allorhodopirellula solitaria TaxID=2527987 RepID=A0A5C5XTV7_9BACT|nr:inorganic diphosphatase [Allorhodopirellula solitaria]TWT66138.1 Inorganic pyrophosphatase [Allorhodopirellula solitaria]